MHKISFGVRVPNSGPLSSVENIVKATKTAEELGFDAIWVHDHVVWSSEMHRHHISSGAAEALTDTQEANFFEATTILSYLAAETKTITLGVACLVIRFMPPSSIRHWIIWPRAVCWWAWVSAQKLLGNPTSSAFSVCLTSGAAIAPMNI
jgi:hypothetical protein